MKDIEFIRGKVPMTKEEVRAVIISKLALQSNDNFMDVGAGTGSVSIEAALQLSKGKAFAIEQKEEAIDLIHENAQKFNVSNLQIAQAKAPEAMENLDAYNKYFIGGSGGNLIQILKKIEAEAPAKHIVVIAAIVIDTMTTAYQYYKDNNQYDFEFIQMAINKIDPNRKIAMLEANNPIFIITATSKN